MSEILPLAENDRARLQRKLEQSQKLFLICIGGACFLPLFVSLLLYLTPIELSQNTIYLAGILLSLFASPFLWMSMNIRQKSKRAQYWLNQNCKHRVSGIISEKDETMITVNSFNAKFWTNGKKLSIGQEATIEYLPLEKRDLAGTLGILRINEEDNPYFESAINVGPPAP